MCEDTRWNDAVKMVGKREAYRRLLRVEEFQAVPRWEEYEHEANRHPRGTPNRQQFTAYAQRAYVERVEIDRLCNEISALPGGLIK